MKDKLEKLGKKLGKDISKLLKEANIWNHNIEANIEIGKYSITFIKNPDVLNVYYHLPAEFYQILHKGIEQMEILCNKSKSLEEYYIEVITKDYMVKLFIDGEKYSHETSKDVFTSNLALHKRLLVCIDSEKYEEAGRIQKMITSRDQKLK